LGAFLRSGDAVSRINLIDQHPRVLPSCQPYSRTLRKRPHQPTNCFRARVREVRDQPTDLLGRPGSCQGRPRVKNFFAPRIQHEDIKMGQHGLFHASSGSQIHLLTTVHPEIASRGSQWPVRRAGVPGEGAVTTVTAWPPVNQPTSGGLECAECGTNQPAQGPEWVNRVGSLVKPSGAGRLASSSFSFFF